MQCCTGSGFWNPIRPDIGIFLDMDWILFPFQPDQDFRIIQMKQTVTMQKII